MYVVSTAFFICNLLALDHMKLSNVASLRGDAFEAEEHYEKAFIDRKFLTNDDDDNTDDDDDYDDIDFEGESLALNITFNTLVLLDFLFSLIRGGRQRKEADLNYLVSRLEKMVQVDETHLQHLRQGMFAAVLLIYYAVFVHSVCAIGGPSTAKRSAEKIRRSRQVSSVSVVFA